MPITQTIWNYFDSTATAGPIPIGTGTPPQIAFWSAAGVLSGDNSFTWDNPAKRFSVQGNQKWKRTPTAISYTLLASDEVISFTDLSVNRTAFLPSIAVVGDGTTYVLKKADTVGIGNLTLSPFAGNTIENVATLVLATVGESAIIIADADNLNWEVIG